MPTGDGWTSTLLTGVAELLDAAGVGSWRTSGAYQPDETAITIRSIPQSPDRLITLAPYALGTDLRGMADYQLGIQARIRGTEDPRVCEDIADRVYELLDSYGRGTAGGIAVVDIYRQSYTSLGQDSNGRWESSSNFYVEAMRSTASRTD